MSATQKKARKKNLKKRLIRFDKKLSWTLFVVTLLTILTGYLMTRIEGVYFPAFPHIFLKIAFTIFLVFHAATVTFLIKYKWKISIIRVFKEHASTLSLIKFTQRITGILVLCSAVLVVLTGLDYWFNWGEPFSLLQHVQFDILLSISFTVHMIAGLKVALKRRKVGAKKANLLAITLLISLVFFVAAFESGFVYTATKEPGNRFVIDGISYDVDYSQFFNPDQIFFKRITILCLMPWYQFVKQTISNYRIILARAKLGLSFARVR